MPREQFKEPEDTRPKVAIRNISARLVSIEGIDLAPGDIGEVSARTFDKIRSKKNIGTIFGKATDKMIGEEDSAGLPIAEEMPAKDEASKKHGKHGKHTEPNTDDLPDLSSLSDSKALAVVAKSENVESLKRWALASTSPRIMNAVTARLERIGAS